MALRPKGGKGSNQHQTKAGSANVSKPNPDLVANLRGLAAGHDGEPATGTLRPTPELVIAQSGAFDAIEVLADHREALTLAGALAVQEHTSELDLRVAATTNDADFAVECVLVAGKNPPIGDAMSAAGFTLASTNRPGIWTKTINGFDVTVDLIVPESFAGSGRRAARLGDPHGKRDATRAVGLELAVDDHEMKTLRSLDPDHPRTVTVQVAGPTALLCATAFKLVNRISDPSRPHRVRAKDAGDVWRLFAVNDPEQIRHRFDYYEDHQRFSNIARQGRQHLIDLFSEGGMGTVLALQTFTPTEPEERVRGTIAAWIGRFDLK